MHKLMHDACMGVALHLFFYASIYVYALCIMHYSFCIMNYALCNIHFALCIIHYVLCIMYYTICIMQYSLCIMQRCIFYFFKCLQDCLRFIFFSKMTFSKVIMQILLFWYDAFVYACIPIS